MPEMSGVWCYHFWKVFRKIESECDRLWQRPKACYLTEESCWYPNSPIGDKTCKNSCQCKMSIARTIYKSWHSSNWHNNISHQQVWGSQLVSTWIINKLQKIISAILRAWILNSTEFNDFNTQWYGFAVLVTLP